MKCKSTLKKWTDIILPHFLIIYYKHYRRIDWRHTPGQRYLTAKSFTRFLILEPVMLGFGAGVQYCFVVYFWTTHNV